MNISMKSPKQEIVSNAIEAIDSQKNQIDTLTEQRNILIGMTTFILVWNILF